MLTITESAQQKVSEILSDEDTSYALRMYVQGGGCSGFSYGFAIDNEVSEYDIVVDAGDIKVVVDTFSIQYLENAIVDFKDDLQGARFSISNPQAKSTCGCGSSFNPF